MGLDSFLRLFGGLAPERAEIIMGLEGLDPAVNCRSPWTICSHYIDLYVGFSRRGRCGSIEPQAGTEPSFDGVAAFNGFAGLGFANGNVYTRDHCISIHPINKPTLPELDCSLGRVGF